MERSNWRPRWISSRNASATPAKNGVLPGRELRQAVYHSHRIIYEVRDAERQVLVLHVRHAAQREAGAPELGESHE